MEEIEISKLQIFYACVCVCVCVGGGGGGGGGGSPFKSILVYKFRWPLIGHHIYIIFHVNDRLISHMHC